MEGAPKVRCGEEHEKFRAQSTNDGDDKLMLLSGEGEGDFHRGLNEEDASQEDDFVREEEIEVVEEIEVDGENDEFMEDADEDGAPEGGVEEFNENSVYKIDLHGGKSVFSVAVHSSLPMVISGGEDETAVAWKLENGQEMHRFTGFKD
jgi:hypothetical protein